MVIDAKELKPGEHFSLVGGDLVYVCLGSTLGMEPGEVDPNANGIWARSLTSGAVSYIPFRLRPQVDTLERREEE